jgi:aryl-alcohol dehydrogenase
MAARLSGASRLVAIDLNQRRLDLARELGATDALIFSDNTLEGLRDILAAGFDFTFNTTQVSAVFDVATACMAPLGTAGFVVNPAGTWSPDMISLLIGGRKLQGIIGGNANAQTFIPKLIDHWRQGRFPFDRLITEFRFDQIDEAWDQFRKGEVIKPILRMEMAE